MYTHVRKNRVPVIHAMIANDPNSHVNFCSTLTDTRAKFNAEEIAVWNWEKAITKPFICFGALVKAYSREVMEAKISAIPTRMYGPLTIHTLRGAGLL